MDTVQNTITDIFYAGLRGADPYEATAAYTTEITSLYEKEKCTRLYAIAFGKAAPSMFNALAHTTGERITKGVVISQYGYSVGIHKHVGVKIYEAGHPLPDKNGLSATAEVLQLLENADRDTLIVCLISGGGSALLVLPWDGISLEAKRRTTDLLLRAGADIDELNTVRKHISKVKGGRLAGKAYPARIISLILSDVIGDQVDVIASGPVSPDRSTYEDALGIIEKYHLIKEIPESVIDILRKGQDGLIAETPKEDNPLFEGVRNIIVGSNETAIKAAQERAKTLGYVTEIIAADIHGEASDAGRYLAAKAKELRSSMGKNQKICLIAGGETTVSVGGTGKGGRNMELALAFALAIDGMEGVTFLSAGTDGADGPTDAAGAIVTGQTIPLARMKGIHPEAFLKNNDTYNFFKNIESLLITGPTGTNVMDLQIILLDS